MCGIAVILPNSAVEVPFDAIDRMTDALIHRGPDARSIQRLAGCHLGHTRLSILDPVGGGQPMCDEGRRFWIVFNGEIFNHPELRITLESLGHYFRSRSDTEVLLHSYMEWGRSCVSRLNGQFAFAVWDEQQQSLFVARDRMGEKPLYFARTSQGHLLIASEMKSIIAFGELTPRIDLESVESYLSFFYVPPDRTIYRDVQCLPPAHAAIIVANGREETWRYWRPALSGRSISETEAVEGIQTLLKQAVRRQMVADVPVGCFLSGGLDSTTLAAQMSALSGHRIKTYSVGFGDLIDELPFARDAAAAYGTDHHELQMEIDVSAALERMLDVYDEPFADSSNIPTWHVCEFARRDVKVVLSGDGADELFGGYEWYRSLLEADRADPSADQWLLHMRQSTHLYGDRTILWGDRGRPDIADLIRGRFGPPEGVTGIDRAASFDLSCYLGGDILVKVDRAAMAHGLETRSPFLDVDLVEFVLSLPREMRFKTGEGGRLKYLMRRAFEHLWPPSVRTRGKQGFGAPVYHWMQQPAVARLWERVIAPDSALSVLLPGTAVVGPTLRPQRRWTMLCLGLWLERHGSCLAHL
ncbi:MAG: asparagine synthase (glutamine-hydrolyzing) [Phycisphaerales bacterium]|jgi:asparagine synthase (glutamine-hydrolysing)|nr:asparagine synthase (glutamine-hydrolyzing) [Phycisphaerales bacterium]